MFERFSKIAHLSSRLVLAGPYKTHNNVSESLVRSQMTQTRKKVDCHLLSCPPSPARGYTKRRGLKVPVTSPFIAAPKVRLVFFLMQVPTNMAEDRQTDRRLLREKAKPFLVKSWCFAVYWQHSTSAAQDEFQINKD